MFGIFEKPALKGQEGKKNEEGISAGEEVVGSIPAEFVVKKDGKEEQTTGEIKVLYDPELGSEGGFLDDEKGGE